ncbi:MAG: hypothetical protein JWL77_3010 [Chthonomonadaceae bacterium]|nr:hypothetical protein [Chthonomonadaceae bacterium]
MAVEDNKISDITRQDIIDVLESLGTPFHGTQDMVDFLKQIWPLDTMPSTDSRYPTAAGDIYQHMINNTDWTMQDLFVNHLDILKVPDRQFLNLLEICVHPSMRKSKLAVDEILTACNPLLQMDGYELVKSSEISRRPVYAGVPYKPAETHKYEVAFSFAGPDRDFVRECADFVSKHNVSVFFDEYNEVDLWGKNLYTRLTSVYSKEARFCVMFVSKHYIESNWTTVERTAAQERAFGENEEYILPFRIDDTPVPGLLKTVGYQSKKTAVELGKIILQKVGYDGPMSEDVPPSKSVSSPTRFSLSSPLLTREQHEAFTSHLNAASKPQPSIPDTGSDEVEETVSDFENAHSFVKAKDAKNALRHYYGRYSPEQIRRIVLAYLENSQVSGCYEIERTMLLFWNNTKDRADNAKDEWIRVYFKLRRPKPGTAANLLKDGIRQRFQITEPPTEDEDDD